MRTEAKERVVIYGLGECGGRIADEYKRNGWDAVAYNSAKSDMKNLIHITDKRLVGNTEGSGRDRKISQKSFMSNINNIKTAVMSDLENKELVMIKVGVAGGTGSGIALRLAELCKQLGKTVVVDAVKPTRQEMQGLSRKNYIEFIKDCEKLKNDITIRFFNNDFEYQKINTYIFEADDKLFHPAGSSYVTLDFRDILKSLKKGYCLVRHGKQETPSLSDDMLDLTSSKYASFITQDLEKKDGYAFLEKYKLGSLDKKHYQYIVDDETELGWLIMLCNIELNENILEMLEEVNQDIKKMNEKSKIISLEIEELED